MVLSSVVFSSISTNRIGIVSSSAVVAELLVVERHVLRERRYCCGRLACFDWVIAEIHRSESSSS